MVRRKNQSETHSDAGSPAADREAFGARLKLILDHWPSADKLARAAGVSASALRKWLRGEAEPSRERLVALARATGVSLAWLVQGDGPTPNPAELGEWTASPDAPRDSAGDLPRDFLLLPDVPEGAAAGSGAPMPVPVTKFVAFRIHWLRTVLGIEPGQLILETAIGDSMEPGIGDGDILLIDTAEPRIKDFGIFVLEVRGERLVKRVQRKFDGSLILISDNPAYQAEEISAELAHEVKVIGKVIWRGGRI